MPAESSCSWVNFNPSRTTRRPVHRELQRSPCVNPLCALNSAAEPLPHRHPLPPFSVRKMCQLRGEFPPPVMERREQIGREQFPLCGAECVKRRAGARLRANAQAVRIGWESPGGDEGGSSGTRIRYQTRGQRAESGKNRWGTYSRLCPVGRDRCGCMWRNWALFFFHYVAKVFFCCCLFVCIFFVCLFVLLLPPAAEIRAVCRTWLYN